MTQIFETEVVKADDLVGEGKKFKSVDDLAKGKAESDAFIKRLQDEMAELRNDLNTRVKAEDQLNELREEFKRIKEQSTQQREPTSPALSEDTVKALIARTITETEQVKSASQNLTEANSLMVKAYGSVEAAKAQLVTRAQELGLSVEDLQTTAAKSPTAFIQLIGVPKQATAETNVLPFKSTVTVTNTSTAPEAGTKEFYDDMRKKNPRLYWDPSTQQRIMDAAKAGTYKVQGYNA